MIGSVVPDDVQFHFLLFIIFYVYKEKLLVLKMEIS